MRSVSSAIRRFLHEEAAQDLIEYALLAAFIGIVGILTWQAIGVGINAHYVGWDSNVQGISSPPDPIGSGS